MEITEIDAIDTFFSDFANSEIEGHGDEWYALLEVLRMQFHRFTVELCEMNDGAYYHLEVISHTDDELMSSDRAHATEESGTSFYRFETKAGALEAITRFLAAAL